MLKERCHQEHTEVSILRLTPLLVQPEYGMLDTLKRL
jgi:hypothetical protein